MTRNEAENEVILLQVTRADTKWTHVGAGQDYAGKRFRTSRARQRDPLLVTRLLHRYGQSLTRVLDVPSGTGRLHGALVDVSRTVTSMDVSHAMLMECDFEGRVRGSAARLPFATDSFDAVICCRLLHHLPPAERAEVARELCRVSRSLVVASFWD